MLISPYARLRATKKTVNARKINSITLQRKIRLASFVPAPRLIKSFHNQPVMK